MRSVSATDARSGVQSVDFQYRTSSSGTWTSITGCLDTSSPYACSFDTTVLGMPENRGKIAFFAGVDEVRFKRQVVPGDTLRLEVTMTRLRGPIGQGVGEATVNGELACRGTFMFAFGKS